LLAEIEQAGGHYFEGRLRVLRATIVGARDDVGLASRELEAGLALLDLSSDPQYVVPLALEGATACLHLGRRERARELVAEAGRCSPPGWTPPNSGDMVASIVRCGLGDAFLSTWSGSAPTPRMEAVRLVLSGRTVEAADLYARMDPYEEAVVRLLAVEQLAAAGRAAEAEAQLRRALAFYRAVGATRVVREAEALLAQPA
jgi:hypothetical protein